MDKKFFTTNTSSSAYRIHYKIWGEGNAETIICVAGLTGNSRDFKFVGEYLSAQGLRVVAIDLLGRGESDYSKDYNDYNFDQYIHDIKLLLKEIGCDGPASCDWLGVSLGGLLGYRFSGMENSPVRRLISVDIGPEVPQFDLDFIAKVIKLDPVYDDPAQAIPFMKMALGTPYSRGQMSDDQWLYFANVYLKKREDGKYIRNYDPNIVHVFEKSPLGREGLWEFWKKTAQPTLSLRGGLSTLFPVKIAEQMAQSKPNGDYTIKTIDDCGHVPSLYVDSQIKLIADWLLTD